MFLEVQLFGAIRITARDEGQPSSHGREEHRCRRGDAVPVRDLHVPVPSTERPCHQGGLVRVGHVTDRIGHTIDVPINDPVAEARVQRRDEAAISQNL